MIVTVLLAASTVAASENLIRNGDFEQGLAGWSNFWARTPGGNVALDLRRHGGARAAHITHTGTKDWSFEWREPLPVKPGEIYDLSAWVRVEGRGNATLCVTLRDAENKVIDWVFGSRSTRATDGWRQLRSRFIIPPRAAKLHARLIGNSPSKVWLDDVVFVRDGSMDDLRTKDLPETLNAKNKHLDVMLHVADATLSITDRRSGHTWRQMPRTNLIVLDAKPTDDGMRLRVLSPAEMLEVNADIRLDPERPEIHVELEGDGELAGRINFPQPFTTGPGTFLVMPVNEGISYPVDDKSLPEMYYHLYGGHGLCMAFYGVTDGEQGVMTIVETPDDAAVRVPRLDDNLCLAPEWISQKGRFGPKRKLSYIFFDRGGYVAMCKRYRHRARTIGLLKTLAEKRKTNPNVDLLIGAVNVWCWDRDPVRICREMKEARIDRILWSHRGTPESIRKLNEMGVLTSRYDIYQDAMNPANFPKFNHVHPDWTSDAWPKDLAIDSRGNWIPGWKVRGRDGKMYPCGVLCDRQAVGYARRRIAEDLKTHPYRCRFIDTTTASSWRECYHDDHPMTRSESRHWKMELLRCVSEEHGLVTGSETGHEAAVPHVHYFEGMLSLGPYRVPDAGRKMLVVWDEVPDRVAKFQTGHFYRLPLWELVYHDCVVAQWYWGDYNNKLPKLWDRRDLFNALYGTPPMFMFHSAQWRQNRERFTQSYKTAAPVARATGYSEMLSHRWLTDDHSVQQAHFADGTMVTVNFGEKPFTLSNGTKLGPLQHRVHQAP